MAVKRPFLIGLTGLALTAGVAVAAEGAPWSYSGKTGPNYWGSIDSSYETCSKGKAQSPVNLAPAKPAKLQTITFHYPPLHGKVVNSSWLTRYLNNGHTIEVELEQGGWIVLAGKKYDLVQFHFHSPSEHRVGKRRYPMEMHLVHKTAAGDIAVVGFLIPAGRKNDVLAETLERVPPREGGERELEHTVQLSKLLPATRRTYRYKGSLTTPPCSQDVNWNVFATPLPLSPRQIGAFKSVYYRNARPLQPRNGRTVQVG